MDHNPTSAFALSIMHSKYAHTKGDGTKETWADIARRVATSVLSAVSVAPATVREVEEIIATRKFLPGGRYLYACGRPYHQVQNCLLQRAEDSREGWATQLYQGAMGLMSGAGIGVEYSRVRPRGSVISRTGGTATGPLALMQMMNEVGRGIRQGGSRRSAIWAGLNWRHPDVFDFIAMKNWSSTIREQKLHNFDFPGTLDGTNISVGLDDRFFEAYHDETHADHSWAREVYWLVIRQMLETAEPGFSVDTGANAGEVLRNACTEVASADDSDICNLGSINLARIHSTAEMRRVVELATLFLLAGTVYSDVPYPKVASIRNKNRRLGLGLMGLHEWLLLRDKPYGEHPDLVPYLEEYAQSTRLARSYADTWGLSQPIKTRAIAPTGTIGIVAETTTGIEPVFCTAYQRRYKSGNSTHYQYVLDPTAKRLVDLGISPHRIEDAHMLAGDVRRRIAFQAWVQRWVDHGISSTVNLPAWGTVMNNEDSVEAFGLMLIDHLPQLRGVTAYPDNARGGQPLVPVSYWEAANAVGHVFIEQVDVCDLSKGGACGA